MNGNELLDIKTVNQQVLDSQKACVMISRIVEKLITFFGRLGFSLWMLAIIIGLGILLFLFLKAMYFIIGRIIVWFLDLFPTRRSWKYFERKEKKFLKKFRRTEESKRLDALFSSTPPEWTEDELISIQRNCHPVVEYPNKRKERV